MKMNKNLHIPQGYRQTEVGVIPDDWKIKYIKNIAKITTGNKNTQDHKENGIYPFFVRSQTIKKINSYSFEGEAILTAGDGVGVGKVYHYVNEKFDYHQRVYNIHNFSNEINGKYFFEFFRKYFYLRVLRMSAKNSVDSVRLDMIAQMKIPLPSKQEQQKIVDILTTWDNAINQQTTLIEKKQQLKKGLMQQIFSQRVRFKDRNGNNFLDWQDEKLGDMCDIAKSGGTPKSTAKEYYDGNIPFLAISDMTKQGKYLTQTSKKISQLGIEHSASWIVPLNTIIYSMYASVGFVSINKIPLATSQAVINLILKNGYLVEFIYYHLVELKNLIHKFIETGAQGNLNAETVKSLILNIPPIKEQQKIAQILTLADNEITKLQTELALLKTQKKGLMQQLLTGKIRTKT
ncbi:Type I restriction-modification system, specificity subunit S [uncultured Gammaproteobacteria bacterium]|nr:Type I restriction-modification system, specificity subunit S [uncultured Gammaproteobacteria bacterium]